VCAARSTESTTMTTKTISTARTRNALFCTHESRPRTKNQIGRVVEKRDTRRIVTALTRFLLLA
jgi:hypothetical protein